MINDDISYEWPDEKEEATKFVKKTYALYIIRASETHGKSDNVKQDF